MSANTTGLSVHVKWLVSVLAGLVVAFQGWSWIEGRIEHRVTAELKTAQALSELDGRIKDADTWTSGKFNTANSRIDGLQRELETLRQDNRDADLAIKTRLDLLAPR